MEIPHIIVNGVETPFVHSFKQLGVHIDDRLTWHDHISYQLVKINKSLFFLQANCRELPYNVRKQLVSSVVVPHFEYAAALFTNLSVVGSEKLESAFRRAVRFIFLANKDYDTSPLLGKLKWLPLPKRRLYFVAAQLYKILQSNKPAYLYSKFAKLFRENASNARKLVPFNFPPFNTECFRKSYINTAVHLWNKLPHQIRTSQSLEIFKSRLLPFLLQQKPRTFLENLYNSNFSCPQSLPHDFLSPNN